MTDSIRVEVVAADQVAWEGDARSVVARTTQGDVGIWPDHEPFLAALVPCVVEILVASGERELLAIDGGFISVADNRVSLLAQYAQLAADINLTQAERELALAEQQMNAAEPNEEIMRDYNRMFVRVKAAKQAAAKQH